MDPDLPHQSTSSDDPPLTIFDDDGHPVTWYTVLQAYAIGCFPMADDRNGSCAWYRPVQRAVITWANWQIPKSLVKRLRARPFVVTRDQAFDAVIAACAARDQTWISTDIEALYCDLHRRGHAHSVEAWADGHLVGGLYGLAIGGVFCGESMFHHRPDASKACLVALVEHLRQCGFVALDIQQDSDHLRRFGATLIDDVDYAQLLAAGADSECCF